MSASEYIKSLLPSFESSRVKDNITNLTQEIDQFTLPAVKGLVETFPHGWKWKNKQVAVIDKSITSGFNGKLHMRDPSSLELIEHALANLRSTLPVIKKHADKAFGRTIASDGLSFDKAAVLQYAEMAEYFINYVRVYTNYVSAAELSELSDSRSVEGVAPDDLEYLNAHRYTFPIALTICTIEEKEINADMLKIPSAAIDPNTESDMVEVVGTDKMDPFGFASLPFPLSIIYRAQLVVADWQVDRYDRAQEEANVQQYRVILLKERMENGTGDASVERSLQSAEDRLKLTRRKIAKLEEEYGINE